MRYDNQIKFVNATPQGSVNEEQTYQANITPVAPAQQTTIFGSAKQYMFVIRLPWPCDARAGYIKWLDGNTSLQISKAMKLDSSTSIYGVEYHGRL